jgi:hypothetical protein
MNFNPFHRVFIGLYDILTKKPSCMVSTRFFPSMALVAAGVVWIGPYSGATVVPKATAVTLGGIIKPNNDDTLAFTPDGNTVFFDRSEGPHKTIMISHRVNERWLPPQVASFSGHWFDQDPLVSPDGSYMLFDSDRPIKPGGEPLTQDYFVGGKAPGSNIWRVDRTGSGWGSPVWLGPISFAGITKRKQCTFGAHAFKPEGISLQN